MACLSHASKSSCYQLLRSCDHLTRPLRSSPITSLPRSYESVRPSAPHRYARLTVLAAWASPFASERLVPAVPRNSLHPLHAPSTPVAVRSVIRHPADLSQVGFTHLVSTTFIFLTTRLRRVHFRSSLGCSPARVSTRAFIPTLTTTAFLPQQLGSVWDLLLKADPEGPSLIYCAACYPHGYLVHGELLIRVLLQHTKAQKDVQPNTCWSKEHDSHGWIRVGRARRGGLARVALLRARSPLIIKRAELVPEQNVLWHATTIPIAQGWADLPVSKKADQPSRSVRRSSDKPGTSYFS
jgi:hypothetical protein